MQIDIVTRQHTSCKMTYYQEHSVQEVIINLNFLEAFWFIANLRLPYYTYEQKNKKVEEIIEELRLTKCSNTRIGSSLVRGISGGERKRTSIGVELLTDPALLFLDEPTTGLDSSTSLLVIEILEDLSKKGVTVVSTIHQPSYEIFNVSFIF